MIPFLDYNLLESVTHHWVNVAIISELDTLVWVSYLIQSAMCVHELAESINLTHFLRLCNVGETDGFMADWLVIMYHAAGAGAP